MIQAIHQPVPKPRTRRSTAQVPLSTGCARPSQCHLGTGGTLTWSQAINVNFLGVGAARTVSVNILDTSFALLGNAYTLSVSPPGLTSAFSTQSADVSALLAANAGKSVVIEFALTVPESFTGPGGFGLDNVSLIVANPAPVPMPTLNEWALISLMILLGLLGIVAVRGRQRS